MHTRVDKNQIGNISRLRPTIVQTNQQNDGKRMIDLILVECKSRVMKNQTNIVNKLKLNINKSRCMFFHSVKTNFCKNINFDVKISKTFVKKVNSYKYLGVIIQ